MAAVSKRTWTHKGETKTAWIVRYRDASGSHRQKTFERKKDADIYRTKVEGEMMRNEHVAQPTAMKALAFAFDEVMEGRLANGQIGRGRAETLRAAIKNHIIPYFGTRKVSEITSVEVEDWARLLQRTGNRSTGGALSGWTMHGILSALKALEDFAMRRGHLKVRFMPDARKGIGRVAREPIRTFTVPEVQRLLNAVHQGAQGRGERDRVILACYVYLACFCGLRLGEINGLKPENIDLDRSVVKVRNSLTAHGELKGPKTKAGVRDVPMPLVVRGLIENWMVNHYTPNALGVAFTTRTGEPMYRIDWNRRWLKVRRQAGLDDGRSLRFHALRHFAASFMIQHQVPLTDVARLMGHETFDTTLQVYAHPVYDTDRHHQTMNTMVDAVPVLPAPERWPSGQRIPPVRIAQRASAQEVRTA